MSLAELSAGYLQAAQRLQPRLRQLRRQLQDCQDPALRAQLGQQLHRLARIHTQLRQLAELTAHYYERGYYRNEAYTL